MFYLLIFTLYLDKTIRASSASSSHPTSALFALDISAKGSLDAEEKLASKDLYYFHPRPDTLLYIILYFPLFPSVDVLSSLYFCKFFSVKHPGHVTSTLLP